MIRDQDYEIIKSFVIFFFLISIILVYNALNKNAVELPTVIFLICLTLGLAVNNDHPNTNTFLFILSVALILKFYYDKNILKRIKAKEDLEALSKAAEIEQTETEALQKEAEEVKNIIKKNKPRKRKIVDKFEKILNS